MTINTKIDIIRIIECEVLFLFNRIIIRQLI